MVLQKSKKTLYLIPFLHQTTTYCPPLRNHCSCILFHFYIKPQRTARHCGTIVVVSYSISTSNHNDIVVHVGMNGVVSYSISTSNHNDGSKLLVFVRVVSYSISTSNHNGVASQLKGEEVVSYSISTSNHNSIKSLITLRAVVSYSISTSNHNAVAAVVTICVLYLIPFLHQTTTVCVGAMAVFCCILFHFYIKPQLAEEEYATAVGCILFHFYIKPQLSCSIFLFVLCCILFHFYIKPQLVLVLLVILSVVSYSISTSNHNLDARSMDIKELYLIPFLHQTTTSIISLLSKQ